MRQEVLVIKLDRSRWNLFPLIIRFICEGIDFGIVSNYVQTSDPKSLSKIYLANQLCEIRLLATLQWSQVLETAWSFVFFPVRSCKRSKACTAVHPKLGHLIGREDCTVPVDMIWMFALVMCTPWVKTEYRQTCEYLQSWDCEAPNLLIKMSVIVDNFEYFLCTLTTIYIQKFVWITWIRVRGIFNNVLLLAINAAVFSAGYYIIFQTIKF